MNMMYIAPLLLGYLFCMAYACYGIIAGRYQFLYGLVAIPACTVSFIAHSAVLHVYCCLNDVHPSIIIAASLRERLQI